jgi:type II restriction/modification system DNA methylase subunit YeeA
MARLIADKYAEWEAECEERFNRLKANEEELNRIFAEIYDMVGEVPIEVEDKYVSVRKADLEREIKSLLSYAVGCMMGRYSLDEDGLILADQGATRDDYLARIPNPTFMPDDDGIIPITDEDYFGDDDIVAHTVEFVRSAYGEETLEENLRFIADALGGKGKPARRVIRDYFLKDFFADHCQIYKKRPIYWLFDSGKKNGFKAITYMHRYKPDLLARVRTDYVHEQQERYRTQIANTENELQSAEKGRKVELQKLKKKLGEQLKETSEYEEKIHHLADQMIEIDLDDGVKVNYAKFEDVLAKIK